MHRHAGIDYPSAEECHICTRDERIRELEAERDEECESARRYSELFATEKERADRLEAENARLKKDAQHWWNMIEFTDATSVRDIHALAQDGCRLFYLRPTEGE